MTNLLHKPIFIACDQEDKFEEVCHEYQVLNRIDTLEDQLEELYELSHSSQERSENKELFTTFITKNFGDLNNAGIWAVYPWLHTAVRILPKEYFYKVRTARNKLIVLPEEQDRFEKGVVAIAGMSVGSSIAKTIALTNGAEKMRIADFDTLSLSNLNRLNASVTNLGLNKAVLCARQITEINPYAEVEVFDKGINEENLDEFIGGTEPASVIFEEVDSLDIKIKLRKRARDLSIPLVMITDNADNALIDIERYDLGLKELFHGRVPENELDEVLESKEFEAKKRIKTSMQIIDPRTSPPRMLQSLLQVGRTLPSVPQLGTATTLTGAVGAYLARKIILGDEVLNGRTQVSLDEILIPSYFSEEETAKRTETLRSFVEIIEKNLE